MAKETEVTSFIEALQNGNREAFTKISELYTPLLLSIIGSFTETTVLGELEKEDLFQEASLALYKASLRYDYKQSKVTFGLFAKICVRNQLVSTKRKLESRKKKKSIAKKPKKNSSQSPQKRTLDIDVSAILALAKNDFTPLEQTVFEEYLQGAKYKEIATKLGMDLKAVDNALARARKKIKAHAKNTPKSEQ